MTAPPAVPAPAPARTTLGYSIGSVVFGGIGILDGLLLVVDLRSTFADYGWVVLLGLLAITFGVLGLVKERGPRGFAVSGLVLGTSILLLALFAVIGGFFLGLMLYFGAF